MEGERLRELWKGKERKEGKRGNRKMEREGVRKKGYERERGKG
jgi:hypothetical protein